MSQHPTYPLTPMKTGVQSPNRGLWNAKHWFPTFVGMSGLVLAGCTKDKIVETENKPPMNTGAEANFWSGEPFKVKMRACGKHVDAKEYFNLNVEMSDVEAKEIFAKEGFTPGPLDEHGSMHYIMGAECLGQTQTLRYGKVDDIVITNFSVTFKSTKIDDVCKMRFNSISKIIVIEKAKPC